jgi:hypothetical protein
MRTLGVAASFLLLACGNSGSPAPGVGTGAEKKPKPVYAAELAAAPAVPISLTTGDGTGLTMTRLDAEAVVDGPLAFTELRLTFQNPEDRVLEGRFAITLPEGAAVSRFAMKIDGKWMEAEMVERQAARRAYEDFLHRRQDPALLEKEAGNEFRARVFPIPAKATKELIVSYSQELPDPDEPYLLALRGLPRIGEVRAVVHVAKVEAGAMSWQDVTLAEKDWQPDRDLAVPGSGASHALGAPGVVAMRVSPELGAEAEPVTRATVLIDTSASRAAGFPAYARAVAELVAELGGAELTVAAFDQTVVELDRTAVEAKLLERMPLGASRIDAALAWAKERGAAGRVIVVTDGVATAGELEPAKLGEAAKALGVDRVDVVLAGGIRDRAAATAITQRGAVLDLDDGAAEVARRLGLATRSGIEVAVDGALWVWPETIDGVQPGDAVMVYAAMDKGATPAKVGFTIGGDRRELVVEPAAAPLVERAAVAAEIARLEARMSGMKDEKLRAEHLKRIVELSTGYRVLSDHTALLVLETEEDYVRFGIDRTALAGIMVAGPRGVEVVNRKEAVLMAEAKPEPVEAEKNADDGKSTGEVAVAAPPPPTTEEVANMPAPAEEESGGTGTAMALDEGRMGRRDSDRAEGQYRMRRPQEAKRSETPAYTGRMKTVMDLLGAGKKEEGLAEALAWRGEDPGDVLALVAVGEAFEAGGDTGNAARAYGSLIDLFPARADLRRFAGERLDRLAGDAGARELAADSYRRAVEQRPDHLTGHRLLAYALVRAGRLADAFAAIEHGLAQAYPPGRFAMGDRILREDLGLIGAAWLAAEPAQKAAIAKRLAKANATLPTTESTRFVLVWETDANDVDFHIHDAKGGHAWYSQRQLESGGELYADVTTGFGPECFTIEGKPTAAPYKLSIHYYSRGPMGYGMGKLQVLRHDGKGALTFEDRPFVVMNDQAFVDLGEVR